MRMRWSGLLALGFALCCGAGSAAAQSLGWAVRAGGVEFEAGQAIAVDGDGNSYVTGMFDKSLACPTCGTGATFGAGQPNETTLHGVGGSQDIFVAKYDAAGHLQWAKGAGGADADRAWGIAVDAAGNSYVSGALGRFTSTATFGGGVTLFPNGDGNWAFVFVVKYDPNGNALWATNLGLTDIGLAASAIAVDATGNSYVAGSAPDPLAGGSLIKVWKLDADGGVLWARQPTGVYVGGATGIAVDASGSSYVVGTFGGGRVTFGAGEPNETSLADVNGSSGEMFLAKYDSSGNLAWATQTPDVPGSVAIGTGVALDRLANAYVVGYGATLFDGPTTTLHDAFIAKYDTVGQLVWTRSIAGNGSPAVANAVAVNSAGNAYITGSFTTSATFGLNEPNQRTLISLGGFFGGDIFVARYATDGSFVSVTQAGGNAIDGGAEEAGFGIAVDASDRAYVTGVFSGRTTFGPGEPNETILATANGLDRDIFVASFAGAPSSPRADAGPDQTVAVGTTVFLDGSGSSDPDSDPLTFEWTLTAKPQNSAAVLSDTAVVSPTFVADLPGTYHVQLTVSDGTTRSDPDTVIVTTANRAPIADAGADQSGVAGSVIQLDGSGSRDPDGDVLAFAWSFVATPPGSLAVLRDAAATRPSFLADVPGTYLVQLVVSDGQIESAPDTVTINIDASAPGLIGCGSLVSGTILSPGEVDVLSFVGHSGQIISLALASTEGFATNQSNGSVALTLVAPSGADGAVIQRSNSERQFTLAETGVYTIRVRAFNRVATGSYNLNLECLFPAPSPDSTTLQCGSLASNTLVAAADVDLFTFAGHSGQVISLALASTGGFATNQSNGSVAAILVAPSGLDVGNLLRSNSDGTFVLPETGTYVVRVHALRLNVTGSYNLNLECLFPTQSPDAVLLQCGSLASNTIVAAGDVDLFAFAGHSGQVISLALASTGGFATNQSNGSVAAILVAPSGLDVGSLLRSNSQGTFVLPETGTYVVRVHALRLNVTGLYNLNLECLFPTQSPDAVLLQCGSLASNTIVAAGDVDLFTFAGQSGQILSIALASSGGFATNQSNGSAALRIVDSSGADVGPVVRTNGQVTLTLPATGTYAIRVYAFNLVMTGTYTLRTTCGFA